MTLKALAFQDYKAICNLDWRNRIHVNVVCEVLGKYRLSKHFFHATLPIITEKGVF